MKLETVGILIALKPLGERDSVARVFTYDYGLLVGMMRGAQVARKNKPLIGQLGAVSWNARLDSQLGAFHWEAEKNLVASSMSSQMSLDFINSSFELIDSLLPEREKYEYLYEATIDFMKKTQEGNLKYSYLMWEVCLLRELGYALDLSRCSGCGTRENLNYLSPKTGRAVCDACAEPYIDKVYKLPLSLEITGCFLQKVCDSQGIVLPFSRKILTEKYL